MKFSALSQKLTRLPVWVDIVFVVTICAAFVGAWLCVIGQSSIDFDEGFSAYIARFNPLEIAYYTALDVHPPLYYIVLHYWSLIVGSDVMTLRFLSVIFGVISLVFAFLLVRRGFGRYAAWAATPLLAAMPLFFHYSGIMRMYSMAVAICFAGTYILVRLTTTHDPTKRKHLWIAYAVIVAAGMWTNYFTALIWIAHMVWLMPKDLSRTALKQFFRHSGWAKSIGIAIILFLPWLPAFLFRFAEVQVAGFWIKPISVDTLPSTLTMSTVYQTASNTKGWLMPIILSGLFLTVWGVYLMYRRAPGQQKRILRLLVLCCVVPITLLILMSLPPLTSSYVYRYILPALCFGALITGIVIMSVRLGAYGWLKKSIVYCAVLTLLISGCVQSVRVGNQNLDSGKVTLIGTMIDKLANISGDTPVLAWSPYTYYVAAAYEQPSKPIYYAYTPQLEHIGSLKMLADHADRGIKDVAAFAKEHDGLWIIAEEKPTAHQSPVTGWRQVRSITLTDPVTGKQPAIAIEYRP